MMSWPWSTVIYHTTALRQNRWELDISKRFLKEGAFHLQQVQSISVAKLIRKLGELHPEEFKRIKDKLAQRLKITS